MVDLRVRSRIPQDELEQKTGKIITEGDYNVLLTGPTRVVGPGGQPLMIYLPKALPAFEHGNAYPILTKIRIKTDNRELASGSKARYSNFTRHANNIFSTVIGYADKWQGNQGYCRQTSWTGDHARKFEEMYPLFQAAGRLFAKHVPKRHAVQMAYVNATDPAWTIPGTPYTTITVNNTFPTGVHTDKGDLDEGFSCLAVWRRGEYTGGHLALPEWRIAVDMQDRDVLLMDAHQWHGNTALNLLSPDAERISLVLYYRTRMRECRTAHEESEEGKVQRLLNRRASGKI